MNVFVFVFVVFCTMAAVVVLIDRFVKRPATSKSSCEVVAVPVVVEQKSVQPSVSPTPLQKSRDVQPPRKKCVVGINELSKEEQDLMHYGMVVGGAGVGYASCFAPQYTGIAMLQED